MELREEKIKKKKNQILHSMLFETLCFVFLEQLVIFFRFYLSACRVLRKPNQETVFLPAVQQSAVFQGQPKETHSGQARRETGGVPMCHL